MTKIWGPMGWVTLHSIAASYPDEPSYQLQQVTSAFLDKFTETITCRFCKDHFAVMLLVYRRNHPEFLDSRRDFFLFTVRAHNTVNKRLDKPIIQNVADCLQTLRDATKLVSPSQFRLNYFSYLVRNWMHELGSEGRIFAGVAKEMRKINELWFPVTNTEFSNEIEEGDTLEFIAESTVVYSSSYSKFVLAPVLVGFRGGRLSLKKT
jgi:hypothetical protein